MTPSGSAELFCHYITWEAFKSTSSFPNKCTSTLCDCLLTALLSMPNGIIMKIVCWNWLTIYFCFFSSELKNKAHRHISLSQSPPAPFFLSISPPQRKMRPLELPPKTDLRKGGGGGGRWRWKRGQGDTSQTSSFSQNAHPLAASPKHVSYRVAAQYTTATHD